MTAKKRADDRTKTLTIALEQPVEFKGQTYSELTFGHLKAKHLAASDAFKGRIDKHMAMLAGMANVPIPVISELGIEDYERISDETVPLMGNSISTAVAAVAKQKAVDEEEEGTPTSR